MEEEKSPTASEQKQGKDAVTASPAPRIQVAAGSPRVWLKITWLSRPACPALGAKHQSGHSFRDHSSLNGGVDVWETLLLLGRSGSLKSPPPPAAHQQLVLLPAGIAAGQPESRICWQESESRACTPAVPPPPCPGTAGENTPRVLLQSPSSTSPHTSTASACESLTSERKCSSPVKLLNWGWGETFQKYKMISATTWIIDSAFSIFIRLMWFVVAGATFQGESLKSCSCSCYKCYLLIFFFLIFKPVTLVSGFAGRYLIFTFIFLTPRKRQRHEVKEMNATYHQWLATCSRRSVKSNHISLTFTQEEYSFCLAFHLQTFLEQNTQQWLQIWVLQ